MHGVTMKFKPKYSYGKVKDKDGITGGMKVWVKKMQEWEQKR